MATGGRYVFSRSASPLLPLSHSFIWDQYRLFLISTPSHRGGLICFPLRFLLQALSGLQLFSGSITRKSVWGNNAFKSISQSAKDFFIGFCAWFVGYPIMLVVGQLASILTLIFFLPSTVEQVAVRYLRQIMDYPVLFISTSLLIVFVVPIVEETLFRGFLQTWLRKWLSRTGAIIVSSLIFALFHYSSSQGQNNIELLCSLFTLSCFLGFVYERQQSLWASIGLHTTFNGISVLALTIQ